MPSSVATPCQAAPFEGLGFQSSLSRLPLAAQSRRYRFIKVWYGIWVSSANALKYSIVS